MKKEFLVPSLAVFFIATAFTLSEGIIEKLGMEHSGTQYCILGNLTGNFSGNSDNKENEFQLPYIKMLPSLITGDKTGAAKELCIYVQQYINSVEFMEAYAKKREAAKPDSEPWRPDKETIDEQIKAVKELEKQVAEMKKNKQMPAVSVQSMEKALADQKKLVAEWSDPTPNKNKWEKNFPQDPSVLIKRRLEEYLTLAATVDFNAALTAADRYGKKKFVNPEYEKKSTEWKAIYRAGKDVNAVVTAFVKEWLKGPIMSGTKTSMKQLTANTTTESGTEKKEKGSILNKAKEKAKEKMKGIIN